MLYGGIIFQVLVITAISYFSYDLISHLSTPYDRENLDCAGIFVPIILSIRFVWVFHSMPYWVTIDDLLKTLDIKYFLRRPMTVHREDMLSYKDTTIKVNTRTGATRYSGFHLHLDNGRKVLFSERNFAVQDCVYIESMLANWGVKKMEDQ